MTFKIGDLVWGKMKGFPPWPGIISEVPEKLKKQATKSKTTFCIFFFGSKNYSFLEPGNLKLYEENKEELSKAAKSAAFVTAVKEIEAYKSGDKSVVSTKPRDLFDELLDKNEPQKKVKRSDPGKKRASLSEDESSKSSKYPDDSSSDESNLSNTSKNKTVNSRRKSLTKHDTKNDEVPQKNLPRKRLSTTPVNENKSKRRRSGLNGPQTHEDTSSSVEQNRNGSISPSFLLPESSTPYRPFNRSLPALSRPESPPKDIQTFSEVDKKNIIPSKLKIGVIGLGTIGSSIVKHLLKTGHNVLVWNRSTEKSEKMEQIGAEVAKSPGDLAYASDITFCCVPNTEAALDIAYGDDGVIHGISEGKSYVELSGISEDTSKDIAEGIISRGGRYLEVRLQGDRIEAEAGTMILIAAGDRNVYNDCETCFASFSKVAMFVGAPGNASKANLIVQLIAGVTLGAVAEALALAERTGISLSTIMEILEHSNLNCRFIIDKCKTIYENNFSPDLSLTNLQNDIKNAVNLANSVDQRLNLGAIANEVYKHAKKLGYPFYDSSAVFLGAK